MEMTIRKRLTYTQKFIKSRVKGVIASDYKDLYLSQTTRPSEDPKAAVGPRESWNEMQTWSVEFLDEQGLEPSDTLLDVGCGTLRAGVPLIRRLDTGNYLGCDIDDEAIKVAKETIAEEDLTSKRPRVWKNEDLTFGQVPDDALPVDVVWMQSVLTHLPRNLAREFFDHVGRVLADGGVAWVTYHRGPTYKCLSRGVDFEYPEELLQKMGRENGLTVTDVSVDHPNGLEMLEVRHRN